MKLYAGCFLKMEASLPTPTILMLRPRSGGGQFVLSEEYIMEPHVAVSEYTDSYGNFCQRLIIPSGTFSIKTRTCVETIDEIDVDFSAELVPAEDIPEEILSFLLPSRYCQSDLLGHMALEIVEGYPQGYEQVEAIRAWIRKNIVYEYGTSDVSTSALDTARTRTGVCRDFSHLGISLCRSLNIPARMVVGYLYDLKPMDLHAWFEAYLGGRWYIFDATQEKPVGKRISVAYGRDAADVALATHFGLVNLLEMNVWANDTPQE